MEFWRMLPRRRFSPTIALGEQLLTVEVTTPKFWQFWQLFGTPQTGWLKELNASSRSCNFIDSDTGNSRKSEASRFL